SWNALVSYQRANRSFVDDSTDISSPYSKYSSGTYTGNTITAETFGNIKLERHSHLVLGAQYIKQTTDQNYINISDYGDYFSALNKDSAKTKQFSLYGSFLITDLSGFNFEIGGRWNNHSIYGNNGTFTVNPSYNVNQHLKIFLNISSGYKIPTLYQLYSEYGNRGLRPESSITYELGAQTDLVHQILSIRAAFFKRDAKELIIFYTDTATFASQYINRDKQNDYGFELEQNLRIGKSGSWTNNLAYVNGKGIQNGEKMSNLFRRPNFTWNSILTLQPIQHFTLSPSARLVGKRLKGPYDIGPDEMPSYYTVDCFLSYSWPHARVFVELHNITNQQYFDIVGYNTKRF
ncbi:MAG TPA: TonB-dependent receptor, partial [Puia sp.]|nr:TonB-dependent receptor [Puia sp.]